MHIVSVALFWTQFRPSRREADDCGVTAILLDRAFLLQRRDALLVRDGPRKVELLLPDGAEIARREVAECPQLGVILDFL